MLPKRVKDVLGQIWVGVQIICVTLVAIAAGLVIFLWVSGKTSLPKAKTAAKIFLGYEKETVETVKQIAPADYALSLEEFERQKADHAKEIEQRRSDAATIEMAHKVAQKQLEDDKAAFAQARAAFQAEKQAFADAKKTHADLVASSDFAKTKELLETVPAKSVVGIVMQWDLKTTMTYLRELDARTVSKILQEMQKSLDPKVKARTEEVSKELD
ncbi:MAG: hypothetical protein RDV41_06260 [Planctomycetota bacterium]|nr:hypothetical protein [Planctomycetota bacterium]